MQLIIMHITVFSIIIPIGVGLWRHSILDNEAKWLLYMLIPVALNQFVSVWWVYYVEPNNIPFYHLFILLEILFLSRIFYGYLRKATYRWLIPLITLGFSVFFIGKILWNIDSLWIFSTHMRTIEGLIILLYAGAYFFNVYREQKIMHLHKTSGFWIGGGLILYFGCNLLLFAFSELVYVLELDIFQSIWAIHAVLTILLYCSFTIALSCRKTETIS
jgi:hypothetical protein